ncbi:MAG: restriction endonuclease subunit S [Segetibacter sp.]
MTVKETTWENIKLKYLASINNETLSEETEPNLEINYIDIGNVDSNGNVNTVAKYLFSDAPSRARRIVRKGDVIISTVRTYLQAITSIDTEIENLIASTGFAVIRPIKEKFYQEFCKYALRESNFLTEVQKRSVGVSYPAINASDLGSISFKTPSYSNQIAISQYLNKETAQIDALLKSKNVLLRLLSEKRQALITQAVTKGLNPEVSLKDSGIDWIGEFPEHWKILQLKFLSKEPLKYGANEAALDENPSNPRFVRITDIDEKGNLKPETFKSLEPEIAEPYLLVDGDILLARSGATVGKAFMYQDSWGIACFAGYLIRVRCDLKKILPRFLILITQSNYYWSQIYAGTIQATIQNFSGEKYGSMKILLPGINEQNQIITFLNSELNWINSIAQKTEESIMMLLERKKALISAAVTGKLKL